MIQSFPVLGNAEAAAKDGDYVLPSSNGFQVGEMLGSGHGLWPRDRVERRGAETRIDTPGLYSKKVGWGGARREVPEGFSCLQGSLGVV